MDATEAAQIRTCQGAVDSTLSLLDQAVELSGWSESTFCMRVLRSNYVRDKLVTGNIKVQRIDELRQQLGDYIKEKQNDQRIDDESQLSGTD